jgi:hypothetical protein
MGYNATKNLLGEEDNCECDGGTSTYWYQSPEQQDKFEKDHWRPPNQAP